MKNMYSSLALMILTTACSSMLDKVHKDQIGSVKKVAIVGFTMDRAQPRTAGSLFKKILKLDDENQNMVVAVDLQQDDNADIAYSLVSKKLEGKLNSVILSHKEVALNKTIAGLYNKKNDKVQVGITPINSNYDRYEAKGIPQYYFSINESKEALRQLCLDLKVDALVFVYVNSHIDRPGIWTLGIGRVGAESDVSVSMYQASTNDFSLVLNQRGDKVKFGDITFMGGVEEKEEVVPKQYKSFEAALDTLVGRI